MALPTSNLDSEVWVSLPIADWQDTNETLHLWTQIIGKIRLALAQSSQSLVAFNSLCHPAWTNYINHSLQN